MHGLFVPTHLVFIVLIIVVLFGPGKLPELGEGARRSALQLRGEWGSFRGAAFMAKGVDPRIGRDVGDMLPDERLNLYETLCLCLLALLIGNTLYFSLSPVPPAAARLDAARNSGLPALVDIWFCAVVFGVLNALRLARNHRPRNLGVVNI